jgi:lipase maturation factor 1
VTSSVISQWLFLKLLGGVYFLAFGSLALQVPGLYGSRGILPIRDSVAAARAEYGARGFRYFPSLFWLNSGDLFLAAAPLVGMVLCLVLLFTSGFVAAVVLALLWLLYLSFVALGQEFLSFQWDALLLETGFMAIFFSLATPPPLLVMFAWWFFLFRFIFSSGAVKLTSGDPTWRNLTALSCHYETQPLPNRVGWYAHHLPAPAQKLSTLGTFFFELAVPFLALGPAPLRLAAFFLLVFFQALIFATGNYGFFNILTIALCVPLLDDRYLGFLGDRLLSAHTAPAAPALEVLVTALFTIFLLLNLLQLVRLFWRPAWLSRILAWPDQARITSSYGLFAVMTTERYEFVIEGSNDLTDWRPYEFRWKPGDPTVPPRQAAPHQPRLDWQMWFAALHPWYIEPWLKNLVRRLLEGSEPVLALLRENPFPDAPPAHIRLAVYQYHFAGMQSRRATGRWWERTHIETSPPMALKHQR